MIRATAALLAFAVATPAFAAPSKSSQKGDYVTASYFDTDGVCTGQYVTVSGFSSVSHTSSTGAPTTTNDVYVSVGNYDYCTGSFAYYSGTLSSSSMSATGSTGTLSGTGELYEYYSGTALPVTVSATVGSEDGTYRGQSLSQSTSFGQKYMFRANGTYNYGSATIVLNGTTYTMASGGYFGRSTSATLTFIE
jgi:hypothetical protein